MQNKKLQSVSFLRDNELFWSSVGFLFSCMFQKLGCSILPSKTVPINEFDVIPFENNYLN